MDNCKFFEEFTRITDAAYPELKLQGATFHEATGELVVRFLISTFDYKKFTENSARADGVQRAVENLFAGMKVSVQYVKAYADESVVKNRLLEYLNSKNQMLFRRLSDDAMTIEVGEETIKITFKLDAAVSKIVLAGSTVDDIEFYLSRMFMQRIAVSVEESETATPVAAYTGNAAFAGGVSLRLVEVRAGEKLYSRGKIENINQMPNYIGDIKTPGDNIVLCGAVSNISKRKYKNKKYDPNDKKSGPEELPIISFALNDTTGQIETVCFPKDEAVLDALSDGDEVICVGKVATSNFTGLLNFTVNAVFRCKIDYDSIRAADKKPVPAKYECVFPQKYSGIEEQNLFDDRAQRLKRAMKGKTYVVFDLETTSVSVSTTEIIEIGAIRIKDGEEVDTFSTLVKPTEHIPEEASNINHITDGMVAFAPPIEKVLPDFYKYVDGAVLVGHNIYAFDVPIIRRVGEALGYPFDNEIEDTYILAKRYMSEFKNFGLEYLAKELGYKHTEAHRALSDVEANKELFKEIILRSSK